MITKAVPTNSALQRSQYCPILDYRPCVLSIEQLSIEKLSTLGLIDPVASTERLSTEHLSS